MEYISIGKITNTHGLKGTLKVKSFTDFNEMRFQKGNQLFIDFKGEKLPITVTKFKIVKGIVHLDVEEYKHINEIEKFKSSDLYISEEMMELELLPSNLNNLLSILFILKYSFLLLYDLNHIYLQKNCFFFLIQLLSYGFEQEKSKFISYPPFRNRV